MTNVTDTEQRFSVHTRQPLYGNGKEVGGSPLFDGSFRLEGAGRFGSGYGALGLPGCSPFSNDFRGAEPMGVGRDVYLPAGGRVRLISRWGVWPESPWADIDYRMTFRVERKMIGRIVDRVEGTLVPSRVIIRSPRAKPKGPLGVHIRVVTSPRLREGESLPLGKALRIRGYTVPPARRQYISLRYVGPGSRTRFTTLKRIRTDRRGRFHYEWRPRGRGSYELWAFYRSQQRNRTDDHMCPRFITVG